MAFLKKALAGIFLIVGIAVGVSACRAKNNAEAVTVGIKVTNDRTGIIEGAFAQALFDAGFQSGENAARYILDVNITIDEVPVPNNPNEFVRITLNSKLTDNGTVILPYTFNLREGHVTQEAAEQRVYNVAAQKITEEYEALLDRLKEEGKL